MTMRTIRYALLLLLAACARTGAPASSQQSATAALSAPVTRFDRFESEILRYESADRETPPAPGGIVFVGSSSIRLWSSLASDFPGLPVLNRGFGGSTLPEVLHYVPRVVLPYRPRQVVLYAGDNDLFAGRTPVQVADDYQSFVRVVRGALPNARIAFIAVKPSPSRWKLAAEMREANRLVRSITAQDSLQSFIDVFSPMLGENGRPRPSLYIADSLHMTADGYAIWRAKVAPYLR
jgi:lysophospholipase L1-like esterase